MANPLLVVHLGYILAGTGAMDEILQEKYGSYLSYANRLRTEMRLRKSKVLKHVNDSLPFTLPKHVSVIKDRGTAQDGFYKNEGLVKLLKREGITSLDIGGEFLWFYDKKITIEEIRELLEKIPTEKIELIENRVKMDNKKLTLEDLKKLGITNERPFQEFLHSVAYSDDEVRNGCVWHVAEYLKNFFDVKIVRELCYPINEPKKR